MGSLISFLIIFTLSVLITKIASQALIHTGLSKEVAQFQARSAFTGVGFTTNEAETIVNHPVRRKIVMSLMLIGNVGIISAMASLILTFVSTNLESQQNVLRLAIILGGLSILYFLAKSQWIEKRIARLIDTALKKFTNLDIKDYVELLNLNGEYEITVINTRSSSWMKDKKLKDCNLREEGINIIGIRRKSGNYIGTPHGDTKITEGDQLILYGRKNSLQNLEKRKQDIAGQHEHEKAKKEQNKKRSLQDKKDKQSQS